jgi:sirohydrochlorin cobaltochelatase
MIRKSEDLPGIINLFYGMEKVLSIWDEYGFPISLKRYGVFLWVKIIMKSDKMKTPVILSVFGTTTKALKTYAYINERCKMAFPQCNFHWAYSSNMVREKMKKKKINLQTPFEVLCDLQNHYDWAVLQSMHLICGHEFYKLTDEASKANLRTSIGLPLLYGHDDYMRVAKALSSYFTKDDDEAVVFVGHGTDHPGWASYPALSTILKELHGKRAFVGVVEEFPGEEIIVSEVEKHGFTKVRLVPIMLIAGVHFEEDIAGDEDSWKSAFEARKIAVSMEKEGLGYNDLIIDIYIDHIKDALDLLPESKGVA